MPSPMLRIATLVTAPVLGVLIGLLPVSMATSDTPVAETDDGDRAVDPRLLDRLDRLDRALIDELLGYAPPAFTDDLVWHDEADATTWSTLRGRVVVLQSWTSRTGAGRSMPARAMQALESFSADDVRIIAVHTPEKADTAPTFLGRRPPDVPVVIDPSGRFCDELGVYKRPVNIVVDRQGAVRAVGIKPAALARVVEPLVAEPFDAGAEPPAPRPASQVPDVDYPKVAGSVGRARDVRGRPAPPLQVTTWLSEAPGDLDRVAVFEFWATWCGPCRKSIPHLNQLADAFREEITFVGLSKEDPGKIRHFMQSTPMRYHVGSDPSGRMNNAIGITAIPHAIVVSRDGIVRWQGHPGSLQAITLRRIVDADRSGSKDRRRYRWTGG